MGETRVLSEFAATLTWDRIPADVRSMAVLLLADSVGCALGASKVTKGQVPASLAATWSGHTGEASILGGGKASAPLAAFANGELMNGLDMDAILTPGHITPYVLPTSLAVAELEGASGVDLLKSIVIGHEIGARIAAAFDPLRTLTIADDGEPKYSLSPTTGYGASLCGAALGAASLLSFDVAQMESAMGVAGYMVPVPGLARYLRLKRSPHVKYTSGGWVAMGGVMSALLVKGGYDGDPVVLDGEFGLWRMTGSTRYESTSMVDGLGDRWLFLDTELKPYPSFRMGHPAIEVFIELLETQNIDPSRIESITVRVDPVAMSQLYLNEDLLNHTDAQLSWRYVLAAAAYYPPGPAWQTPEAMNDDRVKRLMHKVRVEAQTAWAEQLRRAVKDDPAVIATPFSIPIEVSVVVDGKTFNPPPKDFPKGHPRRPMSREELRDKFLRNAAASTVASQADVLWEHLMTIEESHNVRPVFDLASVGVGTVSQ